MTSVIHYKCEPCDFGSTNKSHYTRHLKTNKHKKFIKQQQELLKQQEKESITYHCKCGKEFKHSSSYTRHKKKCHYLNNINNSLDLKEIVKEIKDDSNEKFKMLIDGMNSIIKSQHNSSNYFLKNIQEQNSNTLKEVTQSFRDVIDKYGNSSINSTTNNNVQLNSKIVNNQTKIQFLNQNMSEMIDMNTFIDNYKNRYQFTEKQTKTLLESYKWNGVLNYAVCLCGFLKENCHRQLQDKNINIPKEISFPVVLTDHNVRTFKVKTEDEWQTTSDDQDLIKIIIISNDQVYLHHQSVVPLSTAEQKVVVNYIKKHNSFYKIQKYFPKNS